MSGFLDNVDFYVKQYLTEKIRLEDYEDKGNYDDYDEWFTDVFIQETLNEWDDNGYNFYYDMDINKINISAEELCKMLTFIVGFLESFNLEYTVENIVNSYVYHYVSSNDKIILYCKKEEDSDDDSEEDSDDEEDILRCEKCGYEDYKNEEGIWENVLTNPKDDKCYCRECDNNI